MTKEEQMLLKHFNDLSERAYYQNRPCFSDFLDMNEQSLLLQYFQGPIRPVLYGGYEFAERKIAVFGWRLGQPIQNMPKILAIGIFLEVFWGLDWRETVLEIF